MHNSWSYNSKLRNKAIEKYINIAIFNDIDIYDIRYFAQQIKVEHFLELSKKEIVEKFNIDKSLNKKYLGDKNTIGGNTSMVNLERILLNCDKVRADIESYDSQILKDPNRGHWELKGELLEQEGANEFIYRNPSDDVRNGGVVGIDFGTKSTVVVYQESSTDIMPMKVGTGKLSEKSDAKHYENPTAMEFINIDKFMAEYNKVNGRPKTEWNDLTISHTAFVNLINSESGNDYYSYFTDLKRWCGNKESRIRLKDRNNKIFDLPTFLEVGEGALNPVEIYAYYLGLYINNMHNGIYLNYILSFPVTYEKEIREQIIACFERGLKKSLPVEILEDDKYMDIFEVLIGASEPAAYAVSALSEYGFDPEDDEKVFYGVFDFGGGTTDFDFGIYREANQKGEKRFDYAIEHFGAGGDRYLGGENILELLAYEVFRYNLDLEDSGEDTDFSLRKEKVQFVLPAECKKFVGSEGMISTSQEAKLNMHKVMESLRPIWENHNDYEKNYENGTISVNLYKSNGDVLVNPSLRIDLDSILETIKSRIEKGVRNFFESIRMAFEDQQGIATNSINIFLAGNSAKSVFVKELFDEYIKMELNNIRKTMNDFNEEIDLSDIFNIFPPLGTEEGYQKMEELGLKFNRNDKKRPTGKTGVAFGLVEGRQGGKIKVVNSNNTETNETKFRYYVGESKKKCLKPILSPDSTYGEWEELIDASENYFEFYYTTLPEASTKKLDISETTKISCKLSETFDDEDIMIYIRACEPSAIEYAVLRCMNGEYDKLSDIIKVELH